MYINNDYFFYFKRDYLLSKMIINKPDIKFINSLNDEKLYAYLLFAHQALEKGYKTIVQLKEPDRVEKAEKLILSPSKVQSGDKICKIMCCHKIKSISEMLYEISLIDIDERNTLSLPKSLGMKFNNYYMRNRYPLGSDIVIQKIEINIIYYTLDRLYLYCKKLKEQPSLVDIF